MTLDKAILQRLAVRADVTGYVRILSHAHASTPLGMGFGKTRFSCPKDKFQLLHLAQDPAAAVAEEVPADHHCHAQSEPGGLCDAEQIIHATFDRKNGARISHHSGSIEDGTINRAVVDMLEGTKIAFDNRGQKYH